MPLEDIKYAIGKILTHYVKQDDRIELFFEDDKKEPNIEVIIIRYPEIDCRCIDCYEKERQLE